MKKFLCIILCLIFVFSLTACSGTADDTASEQFLLTELLDREINPDIDFKITDQDGNVCLDHTDIDRVYIISRKDTNRYLELRLTADGAADFKKALKNESCELAIYAGDKKLVSPVLQDDVEDNSAVVLGDYKELMKLFFAITKEE